MAGTPARAPGAWCAAGLLLAAVGASSALVTAPREQPVVWLSDLLVAWAFIACGVVAAAALRAPGTGALMLLTAASWAAGILPATLYWHRGPLVHLVIAHAGWRPRSRLDKVAVGVGYLTAAVPGLWSGRVAALCLSGALVAVAVRGWWGARGARRHDRGVAALAAVALAVALGGGELVRTLTAPGEAVTLIYVGYSGVLVAVAVGLVVALAAPVAPQSVADVVVELAEGSTGIEAQLRRLLQDPTLRVGYRDESGTFRAEDGTPVARGAPAHEDQVTTPVGDGTPIAVLVHRRQTLADAGTRAAVQRAARLVRSHRELRRALAQQLDAITASRRRLVLAVEHESHRLEQRLRHPALDQLTAVEDGLDRAPPGEELSVHVDAARGLLARTRSELVSLARGWDPVEHSGLEPALLALAERSPLPVEVRSGAGLGGSSARQQRVAYYVTAEALVNVAKHAAATRVVVEVRIEDAVLVLEVRDDGVGGADTSRGSGLVGLTERVSADGGRLLVDSPRGGGTTVRAHIPVAP